MTRADFIPYADRYDFCQFVTRPGDLVFVPRYWPHEVTALEQRSSNINWVWTPRTPNLQVAIGRRECAVLALRKLIPGLSRLLLEPTRLHDYGGGGEELADPPCQGKPDLVLALPLTTESWQPISWIATIKQETDK